MEAAAVGAVDAWIERLFECKPLTEAEVRQLCDKVCVMPCVVLNVCVVLVSIIRCIGVMGHRGQRPLCVV